MIYYMNDPILNSITNSIVIGTDTYASTIKNPSLLDIRRNFPRIYRRYKKACQRNTVLLCNPQFNREGIENENKSIIFLPIRNDTYRSSSIQKLRAACNNLADLCVKQNITELDIDLNSFLPFSGTIETLVDNMIGALDDRIDNLYIHTKCDTIIFNKGISV